MLFLFWCPHKPHLINCIETPVPYLLIPCLKLKSLHWGYTIIISPDITLCGWMGSRHPLTNTNIIYSGHKARAAQFHQYLQCFRVYVLWASGEYQLILAGEIVSVLLWFPTVWRSFTCVARSTGVWHAFVLISMTRQSVQSPC